MNKQATDRLVDEMTKLIQTIIEDENRLNVILRTGDVLGALELFTFGNFNAAEQEVIFSRARRMTDSFPPEEPPTLK
jgi:hypothetical protein